MDNIKKVIENKRRVTSKFERKESFGGRNIGKGDNCKVKELIK